MVNFHGTLIKSSERKAVFAEAARMGTDHECTVALYNHRAICRRTHEALIDTVDRTPWKMSIWGDALRLACTLVCLLTYCVHLIRPSSEPFPENFAFVRYTVVVYFVFDFLIYFVDYVARTSDIVARHGSDRLRMTMTFPRRSTTARVRVFINKELVREVELDMTHIITKVSSRRGVMDLSMIHRQVKAAITV